MSGREHASAGGRPGTTMNILIVDDQPKNRKLLRLQLETKGYAVLEAANGMEALTMLGRARVDGVISDILMPNMDGYRLCMEIRESSRFGTVPFVLYTATYDAPSDRKLALSVGADAYVVKPAPIQTILDALHAAAGNARGMSGAARAQKAAPDVLTQYNAVLVRKLEEKHLALAQTEAGLHRAQVMAKLAHVITGPDGSFQSWSDTLPGLAGVEPDHLPRSTREWLGLVHPDDRELFRGKSIEAGVKRERIDFEYRLQRPDGTSLHVSQSMEPLGGVPDAQGRLRWFNTLQDVTEHKQGESRFARLNRVYAVLSGINTLIVRVRDRDELFREACRIAVEHGNFGTAWIGAFDPSTLESIQVAWSGLNIHPAGVYARTDISKSEGVASRAIREKRVVFDNDITAPSSAGGDRRVLAIQAGFRSMVALPFMVEDAVVGHLSLYTREPNFFNADELKLLTDLAGNISFALENISKQQKFDKLARIRAVSSEINAAIVRIHDREALLRETCRIAVQHGKFELVWIGTVDAAKQQIQMVAWHGFSPEVAHAVSWKSSNSAGGTLGEAIRSAKPTVRNDIETEMTAGGMRAEALKRGYHSTVCLPLVMDNNVVVLISIFAAGKGFFDEGELKLLNEVAAHVSFALQAIEKQKKLEYLSYYDVLTGLANRALFLERVAQHMRSAAAGGHKLALFLLDLERFKNINDSLGWPAGDALLQQVAEWLTRNGGEASLLARVGADHFAAVLPQVRQDGDIAHLLEKWMEAFLDHPFRLNDAVFRIALKAGVALYPEDGTDAETLFRNAEAALKKAKASGERYLFHTQKMTESVAGKLTLENQLRQALDRNEFVLHYQPKVNLLSGKVTSAEALIRWNDPRAGLVPPGEFIPILEETGLIHEVGRWALKKALSDYLNWRAAGLPAVRIAVNVSPLQLRYRGFIAEIGEAIGIDAHAATGLELEITESLIMEDVKHSIASLKTLRALGVTIAIDDFGTGFSSLSYLAKLPVDTLKIDRSFVVEMTAGPDGLALVSAIINLAHSLQLKVVAEGVETEEQSRLLRLLNCDEMQGYLFSKPVPIEIFETKFLIPLPAGTTAPMESPVTAASDDGAPAIEIIL